jgi:protein phosphatase
MGDVVDERQGPEGPIKVTVFGRTDVGLVREHNEDNFLVADLTQESRTLLPSVRQHDLGAQGTVLAVCDGMGGAAAGEVASQIAADTLYERMQADEAPGDVREMAVKLEEAVLEAGRRIYDSARTDRTRRGMGTTMTAAALVSERIVFAQVGDSRAYLIRDGGMVQVTRDQSLVNQLIEAGQLKPEEAELFEHSNIILQALGTAEDVTVDLTFVDLRQGDILVMCSDGLSGLVTDELICSIAAEQREPIDTCRALTEAAREGGGHDNITCIVAIFDGDGLLPPDPSEPVEFQRLEIPGRRSYSDRHKAGSGGWGSPRTAPRFGDRQFGGTDADGGGTNGGRESASEGRNSPVVVALIVVAVLAIGVGFGYVFVSGHLGNRAESANMVGDRQDPPILNSAIACHFVPDAPGARLVINGQDYGELPLAGRWIDLPPGLHAVEARRDHEAMSQTALRLREGQRRVEVPLTVAQPVVVDLDPGVADADLLEPDGSDDETLDQNDSGGFVGVPVAPDGKNRTRPLTQKRPRRPERAKAPRTARRDGGVVGRPGPSKRPVQPPPGSTTKTPVGSAADQTTSPTETTKGGSPGTPVAPGTLRKNKTPPPPTPPPAAPPPPPAASDEGQAPPATAETNP